jgi:pilus assembly protein Flp/PilA
MLTIFTRLLKDKAGVTAIEYGLIASLIAVAIVTAVSLIGGDLNNTFMNVANNL